MPCMPDLIAPRERLCFYHQDTGPVTRGTTAFDAYLTMTRPPSLPLKTAFWIRDRLSRLGGVQPIRGFLSPCPTAPSATGELLDFFTVHRLTDDQLCLTAIDTHLGVMLDLQLHREGPIHDHLVITTSVETYNRFGRLYMLPVAPAHGMIVRRMLARLAP